MMVIYKYSMIYVCSHCMIVTNKKMESKYVLSFTKNNFILDR